MVGPTHQQEFYVWHACNDKIVVGLVRAKLLEKPRHGLIPEGTRPTNNFDAVRRERGEDCEEVVLKTKARDAQARAHFEVVLNISYFFLQKCIIYD